MDQHGGWQPYEEGFALKDAPFLTWWHLDDDGNPHPHLLNRGEFADLALAAANTLREHGLTAGDRVVHAFGENNYLDLVFRLAAAHLGTVPVTVNWEADTSERVLFKIEHTAARLLIHDDLFAQVHKDEVVQKLPELATLDIQQWRNSPKDYSPNPPMHLNLHAEKMVIFTSGTTGLPKGVSHDGLSYAANRATFDQFWELEDGQALTCVVTSALHHANATAISDWCMRRPGATLHLVSRYNTRYWQILHDVTQENDGLIVAPVVSRHFDFLASLDARGLLPLPLDVLRPAFEKVSFLIGSAPVGPTTVKRIGIYTGHLPVVRFGSSETCLQVMGIPTSMPDEQRLRAFRCGWAREDRTGYYIGRPHKGHTEVKLVAGISRSGPCFMEEVGEGVPGYLVTRGDNVMTGYVNDEPGTMNVMEQDWYLGLHDIGFFLINESDGEQDFYWMSRESTLLIKGGANYAYEQVNAELLGYLQEQLKVAPGYLDVAVVGLKLESEHEDAACVTVCLMEEDNEVLRHKIEAMLLGSDGKRLTKGARPDRLRFGAIPRNFKGAVQVAELRAAFLLEIEGSL